MQLRFVYVVEYVLMYSVKLNWYVYNMISYTFSYNITLYYLYLQLGILKVYQIALSTKQLRY